MTAHGHTVTADGCDACPVRFGQWCYHPALPHKERRIDTNGPEAPAWCKLREGPLVIGLSGTVPR